MSDVGFYHLTRTGPDQALPQFLGRTLAAGQRALVLCRSAERVAALDAALWQCADPDWLPHGTAADGDADLQPIWLTTEDASPNGARFLFMIDGAQTMRMGEFDRVFDLFDGTDEFSGGSRTRALGVSKGGWSHAHLLAAGSAGLGEEGVSRGAGEVIWRGYKAPHRDVSQRPEQGRSPPPQPSGSRKQPLSQL